MRIKKNKFKLIALSTILLIFFVIFSLWNLISDGYDKQNKVTLFLKEIIPTKIARNIRDSFFIIPTLKNENEYLKKIVKKYDQLYEGTLIQKIDISSESNNYNFNLKEFYIPFKRIDLLEGWSSEKNNKSKHYLDIIGNDVFLMSGQGETIFFEKDKVQKEKLNYKIIENNINKILNEKNYISGGIRDIHYNDGDIYVSLLFKDKKGYSMDIYNAKFNKNYLNFNIFFKTNTYWDKYTVRQGGRIETYKNNQILLTIGDVTYRDKVQSDDNFYGKIIAIDKSKKSFKIVSKGHRNQQGLYYLKKNDIIVNSEHGPKGGDEINFNKFDGKIQNFGWPVASYGDEYTKKTEFLRSHKDNNFIEPLKYYVPSIGISEIEIKENINTKNENLLLVSSLRANSIYFIKVDKDFKKIINEDRLFIQNQRIRDLKYDSIEGRIYMIFENTPSLGVIKLR